MTPTSGYNVIYNGAWSNADRTAVMITVDAISKRLAECLDLPVVAAFNTVFFIPVYFRSANGLVRGHWAYASGRIVQMTIGRVTERLVSHELGHVYQYMAARRFEYPRSPVARLIADGVYTADGAMVTGVANGMYRRHNRLTAPANGYLSDDWRFGCQLHPVSMSGGNSAGEDWADMWMNWVYDIFFDNPAGQALHRFVESAVRQWGVSNGD